MDSKKRALKPIIEEVVRFSAPHTEELSDVLDGLKGKALGILAERELRRQQLEIEKRRKDDLKLRELVVKHARQVKFDGVALRSIQQEIDYFRDDSIALTEAEEIELDDLEQNANDICEAIYEWRDGFLPSELRGLADTVIENIAYRCPLADSLEGVVRHILIDTWEKDVFGEKSISP